MSFWKCCVVHQETLCNHWCVLAAQHFLKTCSYYSNLYLHCSIMWLICNAIVFLLNNLSCCLKVWTWAPGTGGRQMSKYNYRDNDRTSWTWLGSCGGEKRLQSVEATDSRQSPLWIQRSANSQSHKLLLCSEFYLVLWLWICWYDFVWKVNILHNVLLSVFGSYNDVTPRQFFNVQVNSFLIS